MELKINKNDFQKKQEKEYNEALNNEDYKALVKKLHLKEEEAKKNTIKLS